MAEGSDGDDVAGEEYVAATGQLAGLGTTATVLVVPTATAVVVLTVVVVVVAVVDVAVSDWPMPCAGHRQRRGDHDTVVAPAPLRSADLPRRPDSTQ